MDTNPNTARQGESIDDCELQRSERNRYFHGKLMSARDMQAEQRYYRGLFTRHASQVTGQGVVSGLQVTLEEAEDSDNAFDVTLDPGYAVDCCGRPVVVPNETTVTVEPADAIEEGPVWISLVYEECVRETVPVPNSEDACEEDCEYNRILEVFDIRIELPDPDRSPSKPVPSIDFPSKDDVEEDQEAALDTISREYESQAIPVGCQDGEGHTVFLGQYARGEDGGWHPDDDHPRSRVFTNDMLYAGLARHTADFRNPHQASLTVEAGDRNNSAGIGKLTEMRQAEELREAIQQEAELETKPEATQQEAEQETEEEAEAAEQEATREAELRGSDMMAGAVAREVEMMAPTEEEAAEPVAAEHEGEQEATAGEIASTPQMPSHDAIRSTTLDAISGIREQLRRRVVEEPSRGAFLFVEDDESEDARVELTSSDATLRIHVDESAQRIDFGMGEAFDQIVRRRIEPLERYVVDRTLKYTHETFTRYLANPDQDFRPYTYGNVSKYLARTIAERAADSIDEIRSATKEVIMQASPAEYLGANPAVLDGIQSTAADFTAVVDSLSGKYLTESSYQRLQDASNSLESAVNGLSEDGGGSSMADVATALNTFCQAVVLLEESFIVIDGIGSTYDERLHEHNIRSFEDLITRSNAEIAELANVNEDTAQQWTKQAQELELG